MQGKKFGLTALLFLTIIFSGCSDQATSKKQPTDIVQEINPNKNQPLSSNNASRLSAGPAPSAPTNQPKKTESKDPASNASDEPAPSKSAPSQGEIEKFTSAYDSATIHTNQGDITVKFYNDAAPYTVGNFMKLASEKFYDGVKFHRVIKDFMIQGGDPNSKDSDWSDDGKGGPGYSFKDEFNDHKLVKGSLAMANSGANTNGSQFFIVTAASTPHLDGKHTNFGQVTSGMEVVTKIENSKTNTNNHPEEDMVINSIELIAKK